MKEETSHITHLEVKVGFNKGCRESIQISDSILGGMEGK